MNREALAAELGGHVAELGDVEVAMVVILARRLVMGQRQYGKFDPTAEPRNMLREATEEIVDANVYLMRDVLQARALRGEALV